MGCLIFLMFVGVNGRWWAYRDQAVFLKLMPIFIYFFLIMIKSLMNPQESHLPQAVLLVIFYAIIKENVSVQHNFYRYV